MEGSPGVDASREEPKGSDKNSNRQTYDCNICFEDVVDPVVTRCGHLFCWGCLLTWMNRPNYHCPVCHAGITKENVIPLYGRKPRNRGQRHNDLSQSNITGEIRYLFGGMTISMFAFPFSVVLPLQTGQGLGFFNFSNVVGNTQDMTPEQRRAQNNSLALMTLGMAIIAYIVLIM
ncbi:hypothetical protein BgAZ_110870 [Babesia gibsoni]|uniref:RING-type E3 ubiquitin transferase n=1 Tax=Babesia gibsoni TaxID=33632 RepID=A0AAD8UUF0_BABGI|nr:hypothetical protein BgAZ_110870 [Babesia gibsoni]